MPKDYEKINIVKLYNEDDNIRTDKDICYLIETICEILKLPNNNVYFETFKQFNENILQKNKTYKIMLKEYSVIGNKIASELINDPLKEEISQMLMKNYIYNIKTLLHLGKKDKAMCLYNDMINKLKSIYNIDSEYITNIEMSNEGKIINLELILNNKKRIALLK